MTYTDLINDFQQCLSTLQFMLNQMKSLNDITANDIYITRQEAANMLRKGLRQLDRDCVKYNIRRIKCNNGIRVSKRDIMRHLGLYEDCPIDAVSEQQAEKSIITNMDSDTPMSVLEQIIQKHSVHK